MTTRSIIFFVGALGLGGCVFTGDETEGLPCNGNGECGPGQQCIERVCCRDAASCGDAGGSETGVDTEAETESSVPEGSSDDDSVREVCDESDTVCVNGDVLRYCSDDGKLSTFDCRGICGESVETLGCHYYAEEDVDTCVCTFEIETCSNQGASRCDGNGAEACDDGVWKRADCDDVCVEAGYGGADYCSEGTCYCGDACQDNAFRCSDSNSNAICSGGQWYPESCTTICQDAGYAESLGCMYFPGNDSACYCL